jgi:GTPase SAR1 family protein
VGKSAIVKRFLFNTFTEKYKPTVEVLYIEIIISDLRIISSKANY